MASVETYHRVRLTDPTSAAAYQGKVQDMAGYIGSYIVDVEGIDGLATFPFQVVVGFRTRVAQHDQLEAFQTVADLAAELGKDPLVAEVRTLRNRSLVADLPDAEPAGTPAD
jgi:hypothetical protein